jgi:tetratricopeptide (TPR) repeat protein
MILNEKLFSIQVERNMNAKQFEKEGQIDKAIELYEANIDEGFEGNFPYDRLRIIYNKQKKNTDVIRVLEKAVYVFENEVYRDRGDRLPKLERFKSELEKAKLKVKN